MKMTFLRIIYFIFRTNTSKLPARKVLISVISRDKPEVRFNQWEHRKAERRPIPGLEIDVARFASYKLAEGECEVEARILTRVTTTRTVLANREERGQYRFHILSVSQLRSRSLDYSRRSDSDTCCDSLRSLEC